MESFETLAQEIVPLLHRPTDPRITTHAANRFGDACVEPDERAAVEALKALHEDLMEMIR